MSRSHPLSDLRRYQSEMDVISQGKRESKVRFAAQSDEIEQELSDRSGDEFENEDDSEYDVPMRRSTSVFGAAELRCDRLRTPTAKTRRHSAEFSSEGGADTHSSASSNSQSQSQSRSQSQSQSPSARFRTPESKPASRETLLSTAIKNTHGKSNSAPRPPLKRAQSQFAITSPQTRANLSFNRDSQPRAPATSTYHTRLMSVIRSSERTLESLFAKAGVPTNEAHVPDTRKEHLSLSGTDVSALRDVLRQLSLMKVLAGRDLPQRSIRPLQKQLLRRSRRSNKELEVAQYLSREFLEDVGHRDSRTRSRFQTLYRSNAKTASQSTKESSNASSRSGSPVALESAAISPVTMTRSERVNALNRAPPTPMRPRVLQLMDAVVSDDWSRFDIFALASEVRSDSILLSLVFTRLMQHHGLVQRFGLSPRALSAFATTVARNYNAKNPYHNALHAADVLVTTSFFLRGEAAHQTLRDIDCLAALTAALVHDVGHPGTSNSFQVATSSDLALLYNDRSVLEHHHASLAFRLMRNDCARADLFSSENSNLTDEERRVVRRQVIDLVLATDMAQHVQHVRHLEAMAQARELDPKFCAKTDENRSIVCAALLHAADIGNSARPWRIYRQWVARVVAEFFAQGDEERKRGLPVSPLCNRDEPNLARGQIGFIEFVVLPLWRAFAALLPVANSGLRELEANLARWQKEVKTKEASVSDSTSTEESSQASSPLVNSDTDVELDIEIDEDEENEEEEADEEEEEEVMDEVGVEDAVNNAIHALVDSIGGADSSTVRRRLNVDDTSHSSTPCKTLDSRDLTSLTTPHKLPTEGERQGHDTEDDTEDTRPSRRMRRRFETLRQRIFGHPVDDDHDITPNGKNGTG